MRLRRSPSAQYAQNELQRVWTASRAQGHRQPEAPEDEEPGPARPKPFSNLREDEAAPARPEALLPAAN